MNLVTIYESMGISREVLAYGQKTEEALGERFREMDENAEYNQLKVLHAMQKCRVSDIHFAGTSGYGYNSLLNTLDTDKADRYFILKDFHAYADAQKRVEKAYKDKTGWARSAMLNVAKVGKFTSDRTIQQYVDEIWHLDKVELEG